MDDDNDDEYDYSCKSVNFQARYSIFYMQVNLDNTYNIMMVPISHATTFGKNHIINLNYLLHML